MEPGYWNELLRPVHAGRRWLIVVDVKASVGRFAALLHEHGAEKSFAIAGSEGVGDPPDPDHVEWVVLDVSGRTIMDGFRNFAAAIRALPAEVLARVEAWDPGGTARAIGGFMRSDVLIARRPAYGGRLPEWEALEDKITVDARWDAAGVTRAPSEIVPARIEALLAASARLDDGSGVVWAGDNRDGWHGGAEFVRWVPGPEAAAEPAAYLAEHCDVVRVMPFLEGIPCSIHGIVFPDRVLTFRPAEIIILRAPGKTAFQYAGVGTYWEAPPADLEHMRTAARSVGAHLRETVGYRGAFGMDGVLTAAGWRPTELNARAAAGLAVLASAIDELPLGPLNRAIVAGEDLAYRPGELQEVIRAATAGEGRGGGHMVVSREQPETESRDVVFADGGARLAAEGETPDGTLQFGPGPQGGHVQVGLDPERTPFGPPVGPRTAAALMLADEIWDLGVGPLEAAPQVR